MLVTEDDSLASLARSLRDHGASRSDLARHTAAGSFRLAEYEHLGFNYRMTDLQGAVGSAQMGRLEWILQQRAHQAALYTEALANLEWLRVPDVPDGEAHGWQAFVSLYAPTESKLADLPAIRDGRERLMAALEREGISTRPGTHAPVAATVYRDRFGVRAEDYPRALIAESASLALPLYAGLSDDQLERVIEAVLRLGP